MISLLRSFTDESLDLSLNLVLAASSKRSLAPPFKPSKYSSSTAKCSSLMLSFLYKLLISHTWQFFLKLQFALSFFHVSRYCKFLFDVGFESSSSATFFSFSSFSASSLSILGSLMTGLAGFFCFFLRGLTVGFSSGVSSSTQGQLQ